MEHSHWIEVWFSQAREQANLQVSRIPFSASAEWMMVDGSLVHKSGRFFRVIAVEWDDLQHQRHAQPFLHQPEVGILGFVFHDYKLLMQAKIEPGNVGVVQMAPTCQATASNLDRVHGGETPLFSEWFTSVSKKQVYHSLQSEQGSRFFGKFNSNVLAIAPVSVPANQSFRWTSVDAVLELMHQDYLINTDARSSIVCSPWELLVKRLPFTRVLSSFAKDLAISFTTRMANHKMLDELQTLRALVKPPVIIRLNELDRWQIGEGSITPFSGKPFEICQIKVTAATREVSGWDQPILSSFGEGYVELVCGRIDGVLHLLFSFQIEAGLHNAIELGPSLVVEAGEVWPENTYIAYPNAVVMAECKQSDEGGRFFHDISTYKLIDIGNVPDDLTNEKWLTLAETHRLLHAGGWFTNEARSALSLVLLWL